MAASTVVQLPGGDDAWDALWASFDRTLKAESVSTNTIRGYGDAGGQFHDFAPRCWRLAVLRLSMAPQDAGQDHRHTFTHRWKAAGGSEDDLMRLDGWRGRKVMARYGASVADAALFAAPSIGASRDS